MESFGGSVGHSTYNTTQLQEEQMENRKGVNVTGTVGIPVEYFLRMAKHDYNSHTRALPREFYQNSSDAGATFINVESDEEKRTISITDDGCGMDLDTLQNKLLVLGGSKKRSGSTGAFGKAKELLFFAWESYEIKTRDLHCVGRGAEYTIGDRDPYDNHKLTQCIITVPKEEDFSWMVQQFKYVARDFEIESKIFVNKNEISCHLHKGTFIKEIRWASVYVAQEEMDSSYANIRINGQWMFQVYHGVNNIGKIIVELSKHSTEILTSNRDGIKSEYSSEFNQLLKEVMIERKDFLIPPKSLIREKIKGTGTNKVNWDKAKKRAKEAFSDVLKVISGSKDEIMALMGEAVDIYGSEVNRVRVDPLARMILDNPRKAYDFEDRLSFMGYGPDFVVIYQSDKKPRNITDFGKVRKYRVLAYMWTEIVKQVLLDIEWYGEFVCGFNFVQESQACYEVIDGVKHFYLNPDLVCAEIGLEKKPLSNKTLLQKDLTMSACHEVSHIKQEYHDADFVQRLHWVFAQTWRSERIYKAIVKEGLTK
jgi:hypothetical protein